MIYGRTGAKRRLTDVLFVLAVFAVFAAASLVVLLIGADVYRATVARGEAGFELGASLGFVKTSIRQHDAYGAVRLERIGDAQALVLTSAIGEEYFETWLYHHDGMLRELFVSRENAYGLAPGLGQAVLAVEYFSVSLAAEGLIEITARNSNGAYARALVSLQSGRER